MRQALAVLPRSEQVTNVEGKWNQYEDALGYHAREYGASNPNVTHKEY
jgi:hypothetical protein